MYGLEIDACLNFIVLLATKSAGEGMHLWFCLECCSQLARQDRAETDPCSEQFNTGKCYGPRHFVVLAVYLEDRSGCAGEPISNVIR